MNKMISRIAATILIALGLCVGCGAAWADTPDATGTIGYAQNNAATWSYYAATNTLEIGPNGGVIERQFADGNIWNSLDDYFSENGVPENPSKLVLADGVDNIVLRGNMFSAFCWWDISELDLTKFDVSDVTSMQEMFANCTGVQSLDISGWSMLNVEEFSWMICEIQGLTEINMTNVKMPQAAKFTGMIVDNPDLTTVYVSSGTDWSGLENWNEPGVVGDIFYAKVIGGSDDGGQELNSILPAGIFAKCDW